MLQICILEYNVLKQICAAGGVSYLDATYLHVSICV